MNIAIIPARGGSKRIPRKNIKDFHGKPMIAYSIEAAIKSGCFDQVIVSTDDQEIADVALKWGASVPFLRPKNISDDHATTLDVIVHAIEWMEQQNIQATTVCCLYATAPFIQPCDIQKGLELLRSSSAEYCFSATSFAFPIQRALKVSNSATVEMFSPEYEQTRSQDLTEAYHDAGQFYWGQVSAFKKRKPIFSSDSKAVILPRIRVQDIDTVEDWDFAEKLYFALSVGK
ncbi:pseudaminic acid cytidylyltransferase [Enterovibrio norvegicus]|uniref:pseudaminic acid cytidylyltransferase n=1 Tax=Enterovibrio norvegicus TaxID=188144 RepID=UPI0004750B11|nr:pseudaminic acid cytidylyltransferase [Enterovibrio norvegicus]OEF51345.1 pseudaminic acid cytidylyltransferase [Enterovibrio norvegicus]